MLNFEVSGGEGSFLLHKGQQKKSFFPPDRKFGLIDEVLGLISGTSNCHMALNKRPMSVPGIWGPYCSAVLPGLWVLEGGQTAVGSLLDHLLQTHPAYQKALEEAESGGTAVQQHLESVLEELRSAAGHDDCCRLTSDLHVWPDFHGNRAPLADPDMRGAIEGLEKSSSCALMPTCWESRWSCRMRWKLSSSVLPCLAQLQLARETCLEFSKRWEVTERCAGQTRR